MNEKSRTHPYIPTLVGDLEAGKISRREFLRYSTLLGISAASAYALAGKITGRSIAPAVQAAEMPKGGVARIGMGVQEVESPHAFNWVQPSNISRQVSGCLAQINQDNISEPWMAESWEASDDLRTWTFRLRDLTWHNGRQFTADDVMWNFQHILDPATGSSSIGLMKGYMLEETEDGKTKLWDANAIEKVDERTIRFNLKVPQVAIPEHLDHYTNIIIDPEEGGKFGTGSNGLGAFRLAEHAVGEKAVLEAVDRPFFAGGPYLDRLEFVDVGEDASAQIAALASDQIDGLYQLDVSQIELLERLPNVNVYKVTTAATAVVQMIITEKPFDDPRVRLALRYAMSPDQVLAVAQRGYGLPAEHHFVCPIHPDYAELPLMTRDVEKARQLLAEAGYPDGIDIVFNCKKDPSWELAAVQQIVQQWEPAGIRADINVMPTAQFWDVWDKFPMGFVEWAHRPLGFMVLSLGFRTGVPWNPTGFADQEFDDLLTKAEGTLDVDARREVMEQVERIMQERGPIAQPLWRALTTGYTKRVQGFRMHPQYAIRGHELAVSS
jgi:peptide/nickel transport system substrate-binding protein